MRKATSSFPANIAEGCGKKFKMDFAKILEISLGSGNEIEYFMLPGRDLAYLSFENFMEAENQINKIKAMLINLIQQVEK